MDIIKFLRYERKLFAVYIGCIGVVNIILVSGIFDLSIDNLIYMDLLTLLVLLVVLLWDYLRCRRIITMFNEIEERQLYEELIDYEKFDDELISVYSALIKGYIDKDHEEKYRIIRERRDFIDYIISFVHTAKTPITASKLMITHSESDNAYEVLGKVEDELGKIENYLEQALYYTRLDDFEKDYMVEEYALKDMINQVIKKLSKLFIEKKINLKLSLDNQKVYTDKKSFEFITQQILVNSLKYIDEKGSIEVTCCSEGLKKKLLIKDNGIGIRKEDLPRVFDKGFTGHNGRIHEHSTGIGLYLVKNICEKLGHEIIIKSEFGQFTSVEITF